MSENKRRVGKYWEKIAGDYLRMQGMTVLFMNYRTRYSEIDIIAQDRDELVFIEVKYRRNQNSGSPLEAVDYKKQRRICSAAKYFLSDKGYDADNTAIRFDVIGIQGTEVSHIRNAFSGF